MFFQDDICWTMYRRETTFRVGNRTLCHFFLQVLAKLQIFGAGCGSVGEKAVMMEEAFRLLHSCSYHGFFSQRLQCTLLSAVCAIVVSWRRLETQRGARANFYSRGVDDDGRSVSATGHVHSAARPPRSRYHAAERRPPRTRHWK